MNHHIKIRFATDSDVPLILEFIKELAEYEQVLHEVVATEDILQETLLSDKRRLLPTAFLLVATPHTCSNLHAT